ncbi:MAG: hypothetical protein ACYTFA_08970 [Planctomycetota bacterium]|jgi:hypothetical protein
MYDMGYTPLRFDPALLVRSAVGRNEPPVIVAGLRTVEQCEWVRGQGGLVLIRDRSKRTSRHTWQTPVLPEHACIGDCLLSDRQFHPHAWGLRLVMRYATNGDRPDWHGANRSA